MKRREFLKIVGKSAAIAPVAAVTPGLAAISPDSHVVEIQLYGVYPGEDRVKLLAINLLSISICRNGYAVEARLPEGLMDLIEYKADSTVLVNRVMVAGFSHFPPCNLPTGSKALVPGETITIDAPSDGILFRIS